MLQPASYGAAIRHRNIAVLSRLVVIAVDNLVQGPTNSRRRQYLTNQTICICRKNPNGPTAAYR